MRGDAVGRAEWCVRSVRWLIRNVTCSQEKLQPRPKLNVTSRSTPTPIFDFLHLFFTVISLSPSHVRNTCRIRIATLGPSPCSTRTKVSCQPLLRRRVCSLTLQCSLRASTAWPRFGESPVSIPGCKTYLTRLGRLVATLGQTSALKKVSRKQILEVDVQKACKTIVTPEAPMALRLQSNLLQVEFDFHVLKKY